MQILFRGFSPSDLLKKEIINFEIDASIGFERIHSGNVKDYTIIYSLSEKKMNECEHTSLNVSKTYQCEFQSLDNLIKNEIDNYATNFGFKITEQNENLYILSKE